LARGRLVGRRGAADGGGDVGVEQCQAVVAADGGRLIGEPGAVEGRVEPVAGAVAGEHPPGAVGAVGGGGEADDQDPGGRVAEAADRPRPVVLAAEAARRIGGLGLAPGDQPRAASAGVDLGRERLKLLRPGGLHSVDDRSMAGNGIMRSGGLRRGRRAGEVSRRLRRAIALIALVAGLGAISGCGGGGSTSAATAPAAGSPTAGGTATEVSTPIAAAEQTADGVLLNKVLSRQEGAIDAYAKVIPALSPRLARMAS